MTQVAERLSGATSLDTITKIVAEAARNFAGADGATFVLRDDGSCFYVDENAVSPLWKGKRFPAEECISGWCMINKEVVTIRDIYKDPRIPQDAYKPTFVKSLCMVPIRRESPVGAIGSYWAKEHEPSTEQIKMLQTLANISATALENLELRQILSRQIAERDHLSNRQKELEFQLHALAHDLKNPLATMMGYTELLQSYGGGMLDEKGNNFVSTIIQIGERLNRQLERMLALYRLSNNSVQKQHIDLSALAYDIVEGLKAQYPGRTTEIIVAKDLLAYADPDLMRLALENLFANAFKYSKRKPHTWIHFDRTASPNPTEAVFFIEDKGDGFDSAQAGKLFQPLVRLHKDSDFSGTGLGLASVARVIEVHGGKVWAEGKSGEGAKFYFSLPAAGVTNISGTGQRKTGLRDWI